MIAYRAATTRLHGQSVLHDVDVTLQTAALTALCGPNGAGKTTLLRGLAGLLDDAPPPDPRRVAYVPQGAAAAWGMTVREVTALGRIPHGDRGEAAIDRALAACGLRGLQSARVDRISGGQARRVMLARALATEAEVLLLDEPTADLDPAAAHEIMALLRGIAEAGRCVGVVLHALDLAQRYAHRMLLLDAGRVVASGPPDCVMPRAAAAFGLPFGLDPVPRLLPPA